MRRLLIPLLVLVAIIIILFIGLAGLETCFVAFLEASTKQAKGYFAAVSFSLLALDVFLPVPSSIIMFFNGNVLGLYLGAGCSLAASLVSSSLGFYFGRAFYNRINRSYRPEELDKAQSIINRYGFAGIIASRGIPILSEAISILCGNMAYRFSSFFWANFIGFLPISLLYAFIGSRSWDMNSFAWAFGINVVVASLFLVLNLVQPKTQTKSP